MKKTATFFAGALLVFSLLAGYKSTHAEDMKMGKQKITGEVVDLACYMGMGKSGKSHAQCAVKCAKSGIPFAIKEKDSGKLYVVLFGNKKAKKEYDAIGNQAGKTITVEGMVMEKDGVSAIMVGTSEM